jgi:hypothetical protein
MSKKQCRIRQDSKTLTKGTSGKVKKAFQSGGNVERNRLPKVVKAYRKEISTKEMVIRLDEKVNNLIESFANHTKRHWTLEVVIITAAIGYVVSLLSGKI